MDFSLSEEQTLLQSTLHEFLASNAPLEFVRKQVIADTLFDPSLNTGLAELGVPGILIPEEFGGVGLSMLDAALVAEELGGSVVPYHFHSSAVMSVIALLRGDNDDVRDHWLPELASGNQHLAVAVNEQLGARDSGGIEVSGSKLTGRALFVQGAEGASGILVASNDQQLHMVNSEDVEIQKLTSVDRTTSLSKVEFSQTPAELVASDAEVLSHVIDCGRIVSAADTLGAAQTMLNKAVEYAGERKQFNRVIGSFQAVKHLCAEMAADLEPCRSLVWYAAHSVSAMPEETNLVASHAKAHLSEIGRSVARKETEVHGGMGFTDLLGLHYYFKRIELARQLLGTPHYIRKQIAQKQGWIENG